MATRAPPGTAASLILLLLGKGLCNPGSSALRTGAGALGSLQFFLQDTVECGVNTAGNNLNGLPVRFQAMCYFEVPGPQFLRKPVAEFG